MEEEDFSKRLKDLETRIASARPASAKPRSAAQGKYTQSSLAWRMVTELVAGMLLGLAIGYGLDSLFGTLPVFLMLFALLGFAAGVRTMMRTADEVKNRRAEASLMGGGADETRPDADRPKED